MRSDQEWMLEFLYFFDLCKRFRRPDVEQVYLAVQAGLAYGAKHVQVGAVLTKIRPPGYQGLDDPFDPGIGSSGLAFFHWIFDVELKEEGNTNYHTYLFRRKHDGKRILVYLKSDSDPTGQSAIERSERQLKKLKTAREKLLVTTRYGTLFEGLS